MNEKGLVTSELDGQNRFAVQGALAAERGEGSKHVPECTEQMLVEELIAAVAPRAGALQGSVSFKAPQRTFSSSPAVLNNHNPGLSRPNFLSRFKCHLVTNKIHTRNSVSVCMHVLLMDCSCLDLCS